MQAKTGPRGRTPWSVEDIEEILTGEVEDGQVLERLRTADRKGLSPTSFAALKAAATADSLTPLLALLDPPTEQETSSIDLVLTLLERVAESQLRIEQRLGAIESRLGAQPLASPRQPTASVRPASGR